MGAHWDRWEWEAPGEFVAMIDRSSSSSFGADIIIAGFQPI